jgi:hypothetical protein
MERHHGAPGTSRGAPFVFGGNAMRLQAIGDAGFAWLMDESPAPPDAPTLPDGGLAPPGVHI